MHATPGRTAASGLESQCCGGCETPTGCCNCRCGHSTAANGDGSAAARPAHGGAARSVRVPGSKSDTRCGGDGRQLRPATNAVSQSHTNPPPMHATPGRTAAGGLENQYCGAQHAPTRYCDDWCGYTAANSDGCAAARPALGEPTGSVCICRSKPNG